MKRVCVFLMVLCVGFSLPSFGADVFSLYLQQNQEVGFSQVQKTIQDRELEPNGTFKDANQVSPSQIITGTIAPNYYDIDFYEFDFLGNGTLEFFQLRLIIL